MVDILWCDAVLLWNLELYKPGNKAVTSVEKFSWELFRESLVAQPQDSYRIKPNIMCMQNRNCSEMSVVRFWLATLGGS